MSDELQVVGSDALTISAQEVYDFVRERLAPAAAEERADVERAISEAQGISAVEDAQGYQLAGEAIIALKRQMKAAEGRFEDVKSKANKVHKGVTSTVNEVLDGAKAEIDRLNDIRGRWHRAEDERRRAEERRLQEEARKKDEEARLAEAERLEKEGRHAEAEEIISEEPIAAPVIIRDTTPKVADGANRTLWKFRIVDARLIPRAYLKVDEESIGKVVRATKGQVRIPGIEAYPEDSLALKSK